MADELNLRDLDWPALRQALSSFGVSTEVARRIFARVHRDGGVSIADVPGLLRESREALTPRLTFPDLEIIERRRATDGFVKYLFRLPDGPSVEAVRIPLPDPEDARTLRERRRRGEVVGLAPLPTSKYILCLSSQAGCALACDFCATGRLGAIRSLSTWEILAQYRRIAAEADRPVRGIVFMGMGEPFLNYDNVLRAARIFSDPAGPAISGKSITISTAGVVPMIRRFTRERHPYRLIVSLGAPTSDERLLLMPIEKRWPLPELMAAIREHAAAIGGRVGLAYVAIGGVNMSAGHGQRLAELLHGLRVRISLIDVSDESGKYRPPTDDQIRAFREPLQAAGVPVVRRYSGGAEIGAACGTLSATQRGGELVPLRLDERRP